MHVVIVGCTQMAGVFSPLSLFGRFIDSAAALELAGGLCRRASSHCLWSSWPRAAAGQLELPNRLSGLGRKTGSGTADLNFAFLGNEA